MYALDLLCFEPPFRFDLSSMHHFATERGAVVLVAEVSQRVAAFLILTIRRRSAYVTTLDTHPEYRRLGLASALMLDAEHRAAAAGVTQMRLHVFAGNEGAIRFYEAMGYERLLREPDFYADGLDGLVYGRSLVCG